MTAQGACVPFPRIPESLFTTRPLPAPYPACPNIAVLDHQRPRERPPICTACLPGAAGGLRVPDSCGSFCPECHRGPFVTRAALSGWNTRRDHGDSEYHGVPLKRGALPPE